MTDLHTCPEEVSTRVLRDAVERIRQHEAEWLDLLCKAVPSYDPEENLANNGDDTDEMDFIQNEQAHDAQLLLRDLLKEFQAAA
ncbi:hypothetical protein [Streptomyces sp. NPDC048644]|uniref:hypothetical protein n=1 Tax=Streptomyces sp. NPDC048644 TaxID=3365582 RepID=UPI003718E25B